MNRRSFSSWIVLAFLLLCAPFSRAQDGIRGALKQDAAFLSHAFELEQRVAAADFDHDRKPDGAVLSEIGRINGLKAFRIVLHLTAQQNTKIDFSSSDAHLSIAALDVNRDGAPDLVIEKALSHECVLLLLNDGHGRLRRAASETFFRPSDSAPRWNAPVETENLPIAFPSLSGAQPLRTVEAGFVDGSSETKNFPHQLPPARRGQGAPSAPRAPPSLLS